jgi:hemerythrin-like domain-containing protein
MRTDSALADVEAVRFPCAVLRAEHQVIRRVLRILCRLIERAEAGDGFEGEALAHCVEFFHLFADLCHHAKEEDLLFPALEARWSATPEPQGRPPADG